TLIDTVGALNVFDLMYTLTGGGPSFSSEVIEIFIYRTAFGATVPQLGYASAAAVLFGLLTMGLAVGQAVGVRWARRATGAMKCATPSPPHRSMTPARATPVPSM